MVFTPRSATALPVAQTFNGLTDQILLVRNGQLFKLAALPVGPAGADGEDGPPGPSIELRTSDGFLQTRVEGSDTWTDLVSFAQISGATISAAAGVPDNQNGREGDLYINTTNGDLYQKESSTWTVIGNIAGPQGPQGNPGPQGDPGSGGGSLPDPTSGNTLDFSNLDQGTKHTYYLNSSQTYNLDLNNVFGDEGYWDVELIKGADTFRLIVNQDPSATIQVDWLNGFGPQTIDFANSEYFDFAVTGDAILRLLLFFDGSSYWTLIIGSTKTPDFVGIYTT